MKSIEDIIPQEYMREQLYKLMLVNEQYWIIHEDVLIVDDLYRPENNGIYAANNDRLVKYEGNKFHGVTLSIPDNWKKCIMYANKKRQMD